MGARVIEGVLVMFSRARTEWMGRARGQVAAMMRTQRRQPVLAGLGSRS